MGIVLAEASRLNPATLGQRPHLQMQLLVLALEISTQQIALTHVIAPLPRPRNTLYMLPSPTPLTRNMIGLPFRSLQRPRLCSKVGNQRARAGGEVRESCR